ncbi:methyltransferase domain-containing protein [Halocola ammonii]
MLKIRERSREPEILDDLELTGNDLTENLRELGKVNRLLGGHQIAISAVREILSDDPKSNWRIADLGCGGGDTLAALAKTPIFKNRKLELVGLDANSTAVEFAKKENAAFDNIHFVCADLFENWPEENFDIVLFNLVLHHFSDDQIVELLQRAAENSRFIVINDLQRNWIPYQLFRLTSRIFRFSHISRHDGKLSVKKSFTKKDWNRLLNKADLKNFKLKWRWAFRWVAIIDTKH